MSFPQAAIVCHNGRLVAASQAQVPVFHPALYGAYGIYESIQVASDVVFHLDDHLARLAGSAAILEMPLPHDTGQIASWIPALLAASRRLSSAAKQETAAQALAEQLAAATSGAAVVLTPDDEDIVLIERAASNEGGE